MGAYRNAEDLTKRIWSVARAICPDLPETYEEALRTAEPGRIFEADGYGRVMLLCSGVGGRCQVLTKDYSVIFVDAEDLTETGETAPLMETVEQYLEERRRTKAVDALIGELKSGRGGQNRRAVEDTATGLRYESVTEWARQNGLSRMSGYRLLNGQRELVKGHGLEYLDG